MWYGITSFPATVQIQGIPFCHRLDNRSSWHYLKKISVLTKKIPLTIKVKIHQTESLFTLYTYIPS